MIKSFVLLLFALTICQYAKADQHALVTKDIAERATNAIKKGALVTLFCGCCDSDKAQIIEIDKAYYKPSDTEGLYEIWIEGKQVAEYDIDYRRKPLNIKKQSVPFKPDLIDLAYAFLHSSYFLAGSWSKNLSVDFTIAQGLGLQLATPNECLYEVPNAYRVLNSN